MTVPVLPGPFAFLAEAGQAAGSIAQVKEERKRHAQDIAEHGSNFIMESILKGADPSMLDDPEVQKMMKTAYGFSFPSSVAKAMGAEQRLKGKQAGALEEAGEPKAAATAAVATDKAVEEEAKIKGRKAKAEGEKGVPEAEADVARVEAEARSRGLEFNASVYKTAQAMFGTDPAFRKLAVEAATGVMDYKIKLLLAKRENLSIERQAMASDAAETRALMSGADKYYNQIKTAWENNKRLSGDEGDYESKYPEPNHAEVVAEYIKQETGLSMEQFRRHARRALMGVMQEDPTLQSPQGTEKGGGDVAPPKGESGYAPDSDPQKAFKKLSNRSPEDAAEALAELVETQDLTELQAGIVQKLLEKSTPGRWYKKFNREYSGRRLVGHGEPEKK